MMLWEVGPPEERPTKIFVSDDFARDCDTFQMFFDEEETFSVPLDIGEDIRTIEATCYGTPSAVSLDDLPTPRLVELLRAVDYLANERVLRRVAGVVARRLAGKSPRDMATELGLEHPDTPRRWNQWAIPKSRVRPWPAVGDNWKATS